MNEVTAIIGELGYVFITAMLFVFFRHIGRGLLIPGLIFIMGIVLGPPTPDYMMAWGATHRGGLDGGWLGVARILSLAWIFVVLYRYQHRD